VSEVNHRHIQGWYSICGVELSPASASAVVPLLLLMLDEDVFDSVTWETPTANGYEVETPRVSGPGYRQSTAGADGGGPNEPKWEGYLKTSVRDPLKELPDTKDAYVSYLVTAEVRHCLVSMVV
jgi:hypothetical protein